MFSEKSVGRTFFESPFKFRAPPCFVVGCLETNCQGVNEIHRAVGTGGTGVGFFKG